MKKLLLPIITTLALLTSIQTWADDDRTECEAAISKISTELVLYQFQVNSNKNLAGTLDDIMTKWYYQSYRTVSINKSSYADILKGVRALKDGARTTYNGLGDLSKKIRDLKDICQ